MRILELNIFFILYSQFSENFTSVAGTEVSRSVQTQNSLSDHASMRAFTTISTKSQSTLL